MQPRDYIELLRKKTKTGSDYAIAKMLGVTETAVYHWRDNCRAMDNWAAMETAKALDMPLEQVIADMEAFREKRPERRKVWADLAGKFGGGGITGSSTTSGTSSDHTAHGQDRPRRKGARIRFDIMKRYARRYSRSGLPLLYGYTVDRYIAILRQISRPGERFTAQRLAV